MYSLVTPYPLQANTMAREPVSTNKDWDEEEYDAFIDHCGHAEH
jgi:hypothetical protein